MKPEDVDPASALSELRRSFDGAFALPPAPAAAPPVRLLGIRIGGLRLAVRVDEIDGFEKARKVVPLPGAPRGVAGLMGLRGRLIPVYGLAAALGHPAALAEPWLLLCGGGDPVGLLFAELEGQIEVARADLVPAAEGGRYIREHALVAGVARGVLALSAIVTSIREGKEQRE